jgi:hypothetical protein
MPEAQLPALIEGRNCANPTDFRLCRDKRNVRYRQEVWRLEGSVQRTRQVTRTIVLVDINSKSGSQIPATRELKYYAIEAGDTLEEIYDENAAQ